MRIEKNVCVLGLALAGASWAAVPPEGGANEANRGSVEQAVQDAATPKNDSLVTLDRPLYDGLQAAKQVAHDRYGLDWALQYTTIYQATSGGVPVRNAAEGTTDLSATWRFLRHANGIDGMAVGFKGETRTNYTSPDFPAMRDALGTLWSPNDSTSDDYYQVKQVWVAQKIDQGRYTWQVGLVDPGAYINANRFAGNDSTQFFSQPFATNPAKAFPQNGLGAQGRIVPVDWLYVLGVVSNSDANSGYSPFKTLSGQFFYAGEIGLTPNFQPLGRGMYRVMLWQRPTDSGTGNGLALSFDQDLGDRFGAFFRYAINNGELNSVEQIASGGVSLLHPFGRHNDQAGVGVSWTAPSEATQRDEWSSEVYYRLQLTRGVEVSASAQLVEHPAASDLDCVGIFGLRFRVLY